MLRILRQLLHRQPLTLAVSATPLERTHELLELLREQDRFVAREDGRFWRTN
jgi:hypothetical protein